MSSKENSKMVDLIKSGHLIELRSYLEDSLVLNQLDLNLILVNCSKYCRIYNSMKISDMLDDMVNDSDVKSLKDKHINYIKSIIALLIKYGADPNYDNGLAIKTAIEYSDEYVVKELIDNGTIVSEKIAQLGCKSNNSRIRTIFEEYKLK